MRKCFRFFCKNDYLCVVKTFSKKQLLMLVVLLNSCAISQYSRPAYLVKGDTIGVIQMSSRNDPNSDTAALRLIFDSLGFGLRYGEHLLDQSDNSFGANDSVRASDFMKMVESPSIKAILMYRGGYGAVRTIDYIDWKKVKRNRKWICGFSDVTMLHLVAAKNRLQTLNCNMPSKFATDSLSLASFVDAITGKLDTLSVAPHPLNQFGCASGVLVGGNMSVVYSAVGTTDGSPLKQKNIVLFFEDVQEYLYHIDRMMQNFERSGILSRCKAIIVGHMTDIKMIERFCVKSPEEHISSYTKKYNIPVIFGMQSGHSIPNLAFYLGAHVDVQVDENGAKVIYKRFAGEQY